MVSASPPPPSPVVLLSHFCEVSGPSRLLCTHTTPDAPPELPAPPLPPVAAPAPSAGQNVHFVSRVVVDSTELYSCTSTTAIPDGSDELLRKLSLRALSCEQASALVGPGREGPLLFGDAVSGHAFAFLFSIKDAEARGFQRWHAVIVFVPPSALFALSFLWGELSHKCRAIIGPLQAAGERICKQERVDLGIGGARTNAILLSRASAASSRTPLILAHTRGSQRLRDLPVLLRVPDLYKRLHIEFTRVAMLVSEGMLRGHGSPESPVPDLPDPLPRTSLHSLEVGDGDKALSPKGPRASALPATPGASLSSSHHRTHRQAHFKVISLSHLYALLSPPDFRRVLYHVTQGDQLVIAASPARRLTAFSIATLLHCLLPEHCVHRSHYTRERLPPPYLANIVLASDDVVVGGAHSDSEGDQRALGGDGGGGDSGDEGVEAEAAPVEGEGEGDGQRREVVMVLAVRDHAPRGPGEIPVELHVSGGRHLADVPHCLFVNVVESVVVDSLQMMRAAQSQHGALQEISGPPGVRSPPAPPRPQPEHVLSPRSSQPVSIGAQSPRRTQVVAQSVPRPAAVLGGRDGDGDGDNEVAGTFHGGYDLPFGRGSKSDSVEGAEGDGEGDSEGEGEGEARAGKGSQGDAAAQVRADNDPGRRHNGDDGNVMVGGQAPSNAPDHDHLCLPLQLPPSAALEQDGCAEVRASIADGLLPSAHELRRRTGGVGGLAEMRADALTDHLPDGRPASKSLFSALSPVPSFHDAPGSRASARVGHRTSGGWFPGRPDTSRTHYSTMMQVAGVGLQPLPDHILDIVSVEAHRLDDVKQEWLTKARSFVDVVQTERRRGQRSDAALEACAEEFLRALGITSAADKGVVRFWSTGMWK